VIADLTRVILGLHGWAALAVIFGVPLAESSVFLGFVFPGEIAIMLGGFHVDRHDFLDMYPAALGRMLRRAPTSCNCAARLTSAHRSSRT
jgi:membrane protein DedA with SNARE-associated domain